MRFWIGQLADAGNKILRSVNSVYAPGHVEEIDLDAETSPVAVYVGSHAIKFAKSGAIAGATTIDITSGPTETVMTDTDGSATNPTAAGDLNVEIANVNQWVTVTWSGSPTGKVYIVMI